MPYSCYYNKKMLGASWFLHVSLFAERSYRSCGEKFITLPVWKLLVLPFAASKSFTRPATPKNRTFLPCLHAAKARPVAICDFPKSIFWYPFSATSVPYAPEPAQVAEGCSYLDAIRISFSNNEQHSNPT